MYERDMRTVSLTVAEGSLPGDVELTAHEYDGPVRGASGPVFDIGPSGTTFATAAIVCIEYAREDIPWVLGQSRLRVQTSPDGEAWRRCPWRPAGRTGGAALAAT